jgi:di/tricarboxylate transporter
MWTLLDWDAWLTLGVLLVTIVLLVKELASPDLIFLGALAVLLLAGVFDEPQMALVGFSSTAVLTIGSLFVVAAGARKTGALTFLYHVIRPRSGSIHAALARLMLPVSALSAFVNNTPLVAVLVPSVQEFASRARIAPSKLLIPLSYAAVLGGMSTLIGTSTNLVVSDSLAKVDENGVGFAMFELAWIGVPAAIVGFVYFATIGHRLLPEREDHSRTVRRDLRAYQFELRVPVDSSYAGKTVAEAGLRRLEGAFLAHVFRGREVIAPVRPDFIVEPDDVLAFSGSTAIMDRLLGSEGLDRVVDHVVETEGSPELPLYEAVVSSESSLVGKSLRQAGFRERFHSVVLGIHRKGARLEGPLGRTPLEPGDLLVIESRDDFAASWGGSEEFYLVAPLERSEAKASRRAPWVLLISILMVVAVTFLGVPVVTAALAAAILVIFVSGMSPTEARQAVDLSVLLVVAAAFGIGAAIRETELADALGSGLVQASGFLGPVGVLAGIYVITNVLTEILTNNVAAVIVFPIGLAAAAEGHLEPRSVAMVIAIAASASFASPVGYQTNLMVMGPGGYRFSDYLKVGIPLNLLIMALTLGIVSWLSP